jgi:hypothetical protein
VKCKSLSAPIVALFYSRRVSQRIPTLNLQKFIAYESAAVAYFDPGKP